MTNGSFAAVESFFSLLRSMTSQQLNRQIQKKNKCPAGVLNASDSFVICTSMGFKGHGSCRTQRSKTESLMRIHENFILSFIGRRKNLDDILGFQTSYFV